MKVAITCDYLLERNHYTEVIEYLCEIFPEAPIYCFAHKKGAILGHIEQRRIHSTYLSNIVKSEKDFFKHAYKLPALAKNLFISCEFDLIVNVSKGFSQGFKRCEKSEMISYLYDFDFDLSKVKSGGLLNNLFQLYLKKWINEKFNSSTHLFVSREDLTTYFKQSKVLSLPFRISDYALFPKDMFKYHFLLIETNGLSLEKAKVLKSWLQEENIQFQFIGNDTHLESLKVGEPESLFFGHRCSGEHTPVLAAAKLLISFNEEEFPHLVLGALATGRPVVITPKMSKWIEGIGVYVQGDFTKNALLNTLKNIPVEVEEPKKLRAHAMKYHDIKFKAEIKRILNLS